MTRDDSAIELRSGAEAVAAAGAAGALSPKLQDLARLFLDARRRASVAMLDMAEALAQVRQAAREERGEWGSFLAATGTSADQAERLLAIARRAGADPRFRELVQQNFFDSVSTAALVARESTPESVRQAAMAGPAAPSRREVERQIQEHKIRTGADSRQSPGLAARVGAVAERLLAENHTSPAWQAGGAALDEPADPELEQLHTEAATYGLSVDVDDTGVVVHWPGEDPDTFQRMPVGEALQWIRTEAADELAAREQLEAQRAMEAGTPFTRALLAAHDGMAAHLAGMMLRQEFTVLHKEIKGNGTAREHSSFQAAMVAAARAWAREYKEGV